MSAPESSTTFCSSRPKSASSSHRAFFEHNENESDPNFPLPSRTRLSFLSPSKSMKCFKASATSASSKITAASPRKMVLVEKNEDSLKSHSVSVEEVRMDEISPKTKMGFESEEMSCQSRSSNQDFSSFTSQYQSACTHFRSRFGSEEMSGQNRSKNLDFSTPSYHQSTPTHPTSRSFDDADPSLPPYDPFTNYLSPRPQFLHYKPRIELNSEFMEDLLYERDGRRLADSFSDSEGSLDCSGYTVKEQSSPSKKELDHESFPTVMKKQETSTDETHVYELRPETYKLRTMSFQRSKLIPLLLFFSIVSSCVLVTYSPIFYPFMKKDQYFAAPHYLSFGVLQGIHVTDYLAFASRNLQGVATRMRKWLTDTIASLTYSSSFSKQEPDTSSSINMTLSSSMVENIGLEFCRSELELTGKKEKIDGQIHPLDNMINAGEALESNYRGAAEKIIFEHSEDANEKGTGEEIVWNKYEEGLNSFTDPAGKFGTMIKYDQTDKIDFAVSEEVNGEDYSLGFKLEQTLENQVLIELGQPDFNSYVDAAVESQMMNKEDVNGDGSRDEMVWKDKDDNFPKCGILNSLTGPIIELRTTNKIESQMMLLELGQHDSNSYVDAAVESQMMNKDVNGDGSRNEMVCEGKDDNFPKCGILNFPIVELRTTDKIAQPEGIDIANSEQADKERHRVGFGTGWKLDEQVTELVQEVNHPINKEVIVSSVDPADESQRMNQNDVGAVIVNFLTGIQPSIFAEANKLMLAAYEIFSAVALSTTLVFLFMKKKQIPASEDKHRNKRIGSVSGGTKSCRHADGSSYTQLRGTMEMVGDSDLTEMRSSFYNSSQGKIGNQEMTPRLVIMPRESGVSSSISYGSFTTYEKVSAKKGNKDEEVMTPVRRSSRVRKQITS